MGLDRANRRLFGWDLGSFLEEARAPLGAAPAEIVVCGSVDAAQTFLGSLGQEIPSWVLAQVKLDEGDFWVLPLAQRPLFLVKPKALSEAQKRDKGRLAPSPYGQVRDLMGRVWSEARKWKVTELRLRFVLVEREAQLGALVGLDLAAYTYKSHAQTSAQRAWPKFETDVEASLLTQAVAIARGVNIARHLVNTPPNKLYPESFAHEVNQLLSGMPDLSVEIWDAGRLKAEGMGLHLAVGGGSLHRPCLLHLRYRPKASKEAPVVLVGKGVTFDSGGLDIKDAAGMRLMKKDMGGAAAVIGAFYSYLAQCGNRPLDVYVPLAENAISGSAYRPGDVIRARNGMTVEIHNTDAEGRLVLADSLALAAAQTGPDKPAAIVVAATLTGAIKVGLGADIAGLFANDDALADRLQQLSTRFADPLWQMPLFDGYRPKLETSMADINHCATGSYGGAVTAALFLAEFAKAHPFAHLDIYAWADAERGALREAGGSGQAVQLLAAWLQET